MEKWLVKLKHIFDRVLVFTTDTYWDINNVYLTRSLIGWMVPVQKKDADQSMFRVWIAYINIRPDNLSAKLHS